MNVLRRPGAWVGLAVLLGLIGLVTLRVIQATTPADPEPSVEELREAGGIPVEVARAERGAIEEWRSFTGTVAGIRDAVVRARSVDPVESVHASVGDRVETGAVLVRVAGTGIEARVRQAETTLRQAERMVERLEPLHRAGAVSDQEWEDVLTRAELAEDDLTAIRDGLTLTSPMAGTVTEVPARAGMVPDPGDPLVRIADLSRLVVRLHVSATDARALRTGQPARLAGDRAVEGSLRSIALQADPATRLVEIEVEFAPDAGLIPGTFASVEIRTAGVDDAVVVPREAVRGGVVWVVGGEDRVESRQVRTGVTNTDRAEITEGIDPSDRVVVQGASLLSDGTRVRIVGSSPEGDR